MMAGIRATDTKPEMIVRRALHAAGFRYVLHDRRLSGRPDVVLPRWRAVVFINGCFWHGHTCGYFRLPGTRPEFWSTKIDANRRRDAAASAALASASWRVATVWECALRESEARRAATIRRLVKWLRSRSACLEIPA
jgi:DNA mismatch endonuclease (patch repair protein)